MERKLRITVEGKAYLVTVEDLGDSGLPPYGLPSAAPSALAVPLAPLAAPMPSAAAPSSTAGPGEVLASLGGVVESVPVSVGQAVEQGDVVVVLEAMKMRSSMSAPRAGTVARIAVKPGDAVEAGQLLATIS